MSCINRLFLVLASILGGTFGVLTRRSALVVQMSVQFMLHEFDFSRSPAYTIHDGLFGYGDSCCGARCWNSHYFQCFRQTRSVNIDEIRVLRP